MRFLFCVDAKDSEFQENEIVAVTDDQFVEIDGIKYVWFYAPNTDTTYTLDKRFYQECRFIEIDPNAYCMDIPLTYGDVYHLVQLVRKALSYNPQYKKELEGIRSTLLEARRHLEKDILDGD